MNPKIGILIICVSTALASSTVSAEAVGPRSALCTKLQKTVAEVTGKPLTKVSSWDTQGTTLRCIYSPQEGWQGVFFELPEGDAKKLAEWRANFAKDPKSMTNLTDLPELGKGAFRAASGGVLYVHGLAKKRLLTVGGGFPPDVEVQLWKRLANEI